MGLAAVHARASRRYPTLAHPCATLKNKKTKKQKKNTCPSSPQYQQAPSGWVALWAWRWAVCWGSFRCCLLIQRRTTSRACSETSSEKSGRRLKQLELLVLVIEAAGMYTEQRSACVGAVGIWIVHWPPRRRGGCTCPCSATAQTATLPQRPVCCATRSLA